MRTWVCMGRVEVATVHDTRNHAFAIPRTPHWACASAQVRLLATVRGRGGATFPTQQDEPMPGSWDTFVGPDCLHELHVFRTGTRPNITIGTGAIIAIGTATGTWSGLG